MTEIDIFDNWAPTYDATVEKQSRFYERYDDVLKAVYHHVLGHVWEGSDMSALEDDGFRRTLIRGCEWAATGAVTE